MINTTQQQQQPKSAKLLDATNKIQAILDKQFDKLPVTKDIPRLLKKIYLISPKTRSEQAEEAHDESLANQQQEDSWKHKTNISFNPENHSDLITPDDIPKEIIFYQFIESIVKDVLNSTDQFNLPTYEEYISHIDFNDHRTLNNYLMHAVKFGDLDLTTPTESEPPTGKDENKNHLLLLLKCCQQTIVINVLMGLREFTMKHKIHFKDARGAWRIYIGSDSPNISTSYSSFYVAHERSEQLYMKRLDWMQQYGISDEELVKLEENDPREQVNFAKAAMKQLFQFKWQIKLCFSKDVDGSDFTLTHVNISLLGIDYSNEDLTVSHQKYCEKEVSLLEQYFNMFKSQSQNVSSPMSASSDNVFTPSTLEFSKISLGSPFNSPRTPGTVSSPSTTVKPSPLTKHIVTTIASPEDNSESNTVVITNNNNNNNTTSSVVVENREQEKEVSETDTLIFKSSNKSSSTHNNFDNSQTQILKTREYGSTSSNHSDNVHISDISNENVLFCIPRSLLVAIPVVGSLFSKVSKSALSKEQDTEEKKLLDN
ncbi:predicted protein [Naegleria gruberi]|uniref:Predicted protein n=1 Tax=Naegleria gruberi TaxID=5762 RepID=D2VRS1_NAEGR|nr:uncharacterized protein NAEGRDRAFT_51742 [Naegleria gruberi]EFC40440.1 predicted protein [Naegleria gruberi]|eukprot:XP_002673184.1 predicted protein [Naegleria gruberi strain NEG-M]